MGLLTLENIVKEYRSKVVLNGVSLSIERKERLALTGPNGSGKTTLIRIAMGLEKYDSGNVALARGVKTGYLSQDLYESEGFMSGINETAVHYEKVARLERRLREVEARMAEETAAADERAGKPCEDVGSTGRAGFEELLKEYSRLVERYEAMDGYSIEARIKGILHGLGLKDEALTIPVADLSGGEKMRVAIARLLLEEPDLLILDEPTNHLDIEASEWLEGFLKRFEGGVLFVSHDRYFLDQVATRVAELENGTIVERSGNYSSFMEQKQIMREFALKEQRRLEREIELEERKALSLKGESRHRTRNISAWKSREKMVARLKTKLEENNSGFKENGHLHNRQAPGIEFKGVRHVSAEIARAEGLKKTFGGTILFSGVDFLMRGGERIGIIGPNGCGKTTLLNILLGRDTDFEGFARLGSWVRHGFLGQRVEFPDESLSILDGFMAGKELDAAFAKAHLARFQFYGDDLEKKIQVLSGGERVRLYLAEIMLKEPDCLIMDEPTNHLDVAARDALMKALADFKGTILAVSHDRYFLTKCVNRIIEFDNGSIKSYEGNYEAYKLIKQNPSGKDIASSGGSKHAVNFVRTGTASMEAGLAAVWDKADKIDIRTVENDISRLEGRKKELEASFCKETQPDEYREYDEIISRLNTLYEAWEVSVSG